MPETLLSFLKCLRSRTLAAFKQVSTRTFNLHEQCYSDRNSHYE